VDGVDFVETQRANLPTLQKLLTSGSRSSVEDIARPQYRQAPAAAPEPTAAPSTPRQPARGQPFRAPGPIVLHSSMSEMKDRRLGRPDRRVGQPDLREKKVERRFRQQEWREESQV